MCGRYYMDEKTTNEIEKVVCRFCSGEERRAVMDSHMRGSLSLQEGVSGFPTGDIFPTAQAAVLTARKGLVEMSRKRWGYPGASDGKTVINARSETVLEKHMFRDSVLCRRCVIPAAWFYEWDYRKTKYECYREGHPVLFMAGFYKRFEDGDHFVILTTDANESIRSVHDRMPLILEESELMAWMEKDGEVDGFLRMKPYALSKRTDYLQQRLPFV